MRKLISGKETKHAQGHRQKVKARHFDCRSPGSSPSGPVLWSLTVGCVFTRACDPEFKERATEGHGEVSGTGGTIAD